MGERTSLGPTTPKPLNKRGARKARPFKDYLLEGYPLGLPYTGSTSLAGVEKLVDDDRDTCGNYTNLSGGVPAIHPQVIRRLDGIPASRVREAIETLRKVENKRINGPALVAALEARIWRRPASFCEETVSRQFSKAAELLESMVTMKDVA